MGQYFRVVNLDKREYFEAFDDEPDKRPDLAPKTLAALARLLMTSQFPRGGVRTVDDGAEVRFGPTPDGRWCGDRVVILGDESRRLFVVDGSETSGAYLCELIDAEDGRWTNISEVASSDLWS